MKTVKGSLMGCISIEIKLYYFIIIILKRAHRFNGVPFLFRLEVQIFLNENPAYRCRIPNLP
jgi:hypothetical protein